MTYTTAVEMTPAMTTSARTIGEAMIAMRKTGNTDAYRAAMIASREQHGPDLHEIVKGRAIAGATGGRA